MIVLKKEIHGTTACYQKSKCRCDLCRVAQKEYSKVIRRRASIEAQNRKRIKEGERNKKWREENPETYKAEYKRRNETRKGKKDFLKRYGMTLEDYNTLMEMQRGLCAICRKRTPGNLHVDHNHNTGKVRALLCRNCNTSLGLLREDPWIMRRAAEYIELHKGEVWE